LGREFNNNEIENIIVSKKIKYFKLKETAKIAAKLLANGYILGWFQGRSEFGPRALGNRCILADPRPAENKNRINSMIKKREGYRPFAPSVKSEAFNKYFVLPGLIDNNFSTMSIILRVKEEYQKILGAITHVDGSARVQRVTRDLNPRYWELISEFGRKTGIEILLNTSFNNHREPIVNSVRDAINCYLTTELNYLVVGSFLIKKKPIDIKEKIGDLFIDIEPFWIMESFKSMINIREKSIRNILYNLYKKKLNTGTLVQKYPSRMPYFNGEYSLSKEVKRLLRANDLSGTLKEIASSCNIDLTPKICIEIANLWSERVLYLSPDGKAPQRIETSSLDYRWGSG